VDPVQAMSEFNELIQSSLGSKEEASSSFNMAGLPDLKGDLADIFYGAGDPPPGTYTFL